MYLGSSEPQEELRSEKLNQTSGKDSSDLRCLCSHNEPECLPSTLKEREKDRRGRTEGGRKEKKRISSIQQL